MKAIRTFLTAGAFAVALGAGSAWAQANDVTIGQRGENNGAGVAQTGRANDARIVQVGNDHLATMRQNGARNRGFIRQYGRGSTAALTQNGDDNRGAIIQFGNNQNAELVQNGRSDVAIVQTPEGTREMSTNNILLRPILRGVR
ncbi:MAG: hypothetical protein JNM59_06865 [Hyphomonadaceae bacterium]|nr:hypothetical protein [Hyphomonadaceae bacterium]